VSISGAATGGWRHAEERLDLRKITARRAAGAQGFKEHLRARLAERTLGFLPHALGNERAHFARLGHTLHQLHGLIGHTEAQVGVAGGGKRATRRMRTGSSTKASDTWRSIRASEVRLSAPYGSTIWPPSPRPSR